MSDEEFSPVGRKFEIEEPRESTRCLACMEWVTWVDPDGVCYQCGVAS